MQAKASEKKRTVSQQFGVQRLPVSFRPLDKIDVIDFGLDDQWKSRVGLQISGLDQARHADQFWFDGHEFIFLACLMVFHRLSFSFKIV